MSISRVTLSLVTTFMVTNRGMIEDGAFSHKVDYVTIYYEIINLKGHPNRITGSRVTAIFLNGWILPIGGASAVEGLRPTFIHNSSYIMNILGQSIIN